MYDGVSSRYGDRADGNDFIVALEEALDHRQYSDCFDSLFRHARISLFCHVAQSGRFGRGKLVAVSA